MRVRVVVGPLIGDLSIHFTQCRRGCKREKPKGLNGRSWMGGPAGAGRDTFFYLSESQRAHLLLADGRRLLLACPVPSPQPHHGLVTHSTNWQRVVCHPHTRLLDLDSVFHSRSCILERDLLCSPSQ